MDDRLRQTDSPRLILVGGSNISLSINSQILLDSLHLNPINTGLSVGIGFVYMFDNTLKYIKPGDIVVASLEHEHFFDRAAYGETDLLRTIFDVAPGEFFGLRGQQMFNMIAKVPYYSLTKLKPREYFFKRDPREVYDRDSFNQYGDNCKHWNLKPRVFAPVGPLPSEPDQFAFDLLYNYKLAVEEKGATFFLAFPALQRTAFDKRRASIEGIERELRKRDYVFLGTADRNLVPDSMIFDSPYHLTKTAVDLNTALLVEDLKNALDLD